VVSAVCRDDHSTLPDAQGKACAQALRESDVGKFFEALGGKLGDTWSQVFRKPAFFFWTGGLLLWALQGSNRQRLESWAANLPLTVHVPIPIAGFLVLFVGFLVVEASESLAKVVELPLTRLLEGYWPRQIDRLRALRVLRWNTLHSKREGRFQKLQKKLGDGTLSFRDREDLTQVDKELRSLPSNSSDRMPTRFGNLLRAAERRPLEKYGLDAVICWPRLWLLLPDGAKNELVQARSSVNEGVDVWFWSLLFMVWTVWTWWACIISLAGLFLAYRWIVRAAEVFGDLLESTFDVHRAALYSALRWPPPANASEERAAGEKVTQYLWRGSDDRRTRFTTREEIQPTR